MTEPAIQVEVGEASGAAADAPALSEISVMVDAGGAHAFSIVLSADGTIRRRRAGVEGGPDLDTVIGTAHPELFEQVRSMITPQLLQWCRPPRPRTSLCGELREIEVRLKHADGHEVLSHWQHGGGDASGPPSQVIEFAAATVEATNRWYGQEKDRQRRPRTRGRPGWHLVS
jgi:hypothetical protein